VGNDLADAAGAYYQNFAHCLFLPEFVESEVLDTHFRPWFDTSQRTEILAVRLLEVRSP
jgi:hypothetical protein